MADKHRVLMVGLDGATWKLLTPLIEKGYMPNLAKLRDEGAWGVLQSTIPPVTAPAWATLQTGVLPGKHGVYDFNQYQPGRYRTAFANSQHIPLPTIWELASRAGKRVVVVNVPLTYPPRQVNGVMITGMQTPSLKSDFIYPREWGEDFLKAVPDYTIIVPQTEFNLKGLKGFLKASVKAERARFRAFRYLVTEKCADWDLAMVHVQSTDTVQHAIYCWLDPSDDRFAEHLFERAAWFYEAIDEEIGALVRDLAGENTLVVLFSDHGHDSIYKTINLNAYLWQEGLLAFQGQGTAASTSTLLRRAMRVLLRLDRWNLNKALLPKCLRRPLLEHLSKRVIDWSHTWAYMINGWIYGCIYINLQGREPEGLVQPSQYEEARSRVVAALERLVDPQTGQRIVHRIYRREEVFKGPFLERAPDLVVEPAPGYEFSASPFQDVDTIVRTNLIRRDHTGSHTREGVVVLAGSMVSPKAALKRAHLVDLFPTVLAWLEVPIPTYTDGHVWTEVFKEELPVRKDESFLPAPLATPPEQAYSEEEAKEIEERLRALGYM